jgi:hypothetical protein
LRYTFLLSLRRLCYDLHLVARLQLSVLEQADVAASIKLPETAQLRMLDPFRRENAVYLGAILCSHEPLDAVPLRKLLRRELREQDAKLIPLMEGILGRLACGVHHALRCLAIDVAADDCRAEHAAILKRGLL